MTDRQKRVRELKQYVANVDATFPTSVILSLSSDDAAFDERTQMMSINKDEGVARIIDGQHRIAGLEGFEGDFQLPVTVFVDMDIEDQAMTFAVINLSQTKVNKSLAYDLYEFQTHRSPTKTCHSLARVLNREKGSPLRGRIKILGKAAMGTPYEFITQATFVESLLPYITSNAMEDRDRLRRGDRIDDYGEQENTRFVFRDMFRRKRDVAIGNIIWNYFDAVELRWSTAWNSQEAGDVLNRTTGFRALMRFLGPVFCERGSGEKLSSESTLAILKTVKLRDSDFTVDRFKPGSSGEAALFRAFREDSGLA